MSALHSIIRIDRDKTPPTSMQQTPALPVPPCCSTSTQRAAPRVPQGQRGRASARVVFQPLQARPQLHIVEHRRHQQRRSNVPGQRDDHTPAPRRRLETHHALDGVVVGLHTMVASSACLRGAHAWRSALWSAAQMPGFTLKPNPARRRAQAACQRLGVETKHKSQNVCHQNTTLPSTNTAPTTASTSDATVPSVHAVSTDPACSSATAAARPGVPSSRSASHRSRQRSSV